MEKLTVSVPEAAKLLGIGRISAYRAIDDGTLPALRIGRRLVVPKTALEELLARAGKREAKR